MTESLTEDGHQVPHGGISTTIATEKLPKDSHRWVEGTMLVTIASNGPGSAADLCRTNHLELPLLLFSLNATLDKSPRRLQSTRRRRNINA